MTSVEISFFWLPLSTMKCSVIPFTHICECKRCSPSSGSSRSYGWICVVATMTLGSASIILFPLSLTMTLGSESESESGSDSEALILATNDCFERHLWVLYHGILWNLHHFPVYFFVFLLPFFACDLDGLSLLFPLFYGSRFLFPCLCVGFEDPNYRLFFCLKFCSILTAFR